jgi:hypothetical protein
VSHASPLQNRDDNTFLTGQSKRLNETACLKVLTKDEVLFNKNHFRSPHQSLRAGREEGRNLFSLKHILFQLCKHLVRTAIFYKEVLIAPAWENVNLSREFQRSCSISQGSPVSERL